VEVAEDLMLFSNNPERRRDERKIGDIDSQTFVDPFLV
jgi:hypothetical protein